MGIRNGLIATARDGWYCMGVRNGLIATVQGMDGIVWALGMG